jgi:hypothetical protein
MRGGTSIARNGRMTHQTDSLGSSDLTCHRCNSDDVFLIVPMSGTNPWDWFRCGRCAYVFTPSSIDEPGIPRFGLADSPD